MGYKANYGYRDGSGEYYITINTNHCDGCGACVEACPENVFEVIVDDYDDEVAKVREAVSKDLKYVCAGCKPIGQEYKLPCVESCPGKAISHSW